MDADQGRGSSCNSSELDAKGLAGLGFVDLHPLDGGCQSEVYRALYCGQMVVVKVLDQAAAPIVRRNTEAVARLAELNDQVVGPQRIDGRYVNGFDRRVCIVYPFIKGDPPDVRRQDHVELMGSTLSALHQSMRDLGDTDFEAVSAWRAGAGPGADTNLLGQSQLIHGDYANQNLIYDGSGMRVIDFGEMGAGTREFEISNTLFMSHFDAVMGNDIGMYHQFRHWFVSSYSATSQVELADEIVDQGIAIRREALRHWLSDPKQAPVGIRGATSSWRRTLEQFLAGTATTGC